MVRHNAAHDDARNHRHKHRDEQDLLNSVPLHPNPTSHLGPR